MQEARDILASRDRGNTFVMSCSAVRFDDQIISAKHIIQSGSIGDVTAATVTLGGGPMHVPWFIIHGIEAITSIFGHTVRSVHTVAAEECFDVGEFRQPRAHAVQLVFGDGGPLVNFTMVYERPRRRPTEVYQLVYALRCLVLDACVNTRMLRTIFLHRPCKVYIAERLEGLG